MSFIETEKVRSGKTSYYSIAVLGILGVFFIIFFWFQAFIHLIHSASVCNFRNGGGGTERERYGVGLSSHTFSSYRDLE